ncbi:MutS-related protein [Tuwongella immobilis]|uniref:DNA mismatch repair proteins mutS family domain-containing protein n=1 Tax=Tuwongella immobilis TaxID=692036 RepID=A0A6C2YTE4_9BACT|nr:DNA mismatch repair protein MutS [Tuwongella immobilis]VIP04998.1 dna mismatch repair protein : DNA mismatch repair protein MutS domain protein OS=Isosphaera pallida (strain ATCC 43644 / DSM 9630 / IS1B) GN=Isop_1415 PE=4 SV=1: MutS_V [Tuwongella immobilis]VTS07354.1 dna mismatch repair protein : DNA mismatch repair protein MutS domain protein OS=Isosphaera pallida (strain ATCC 43644 / DSM 9630 / IS1B) GN=Isop_1415 PE=4 SV=1: MutS_V [Tuwongella immobilis]
MNAPTLPPMPAADSVYAERLAERQTESAQLAAQLDRLGQARVGLFLLAGLIGILALGPKWLSGWWLLPLLAGFLVLLIRYDRIEQRLYRAKRAVRYYTLGRERLAGRWAGQGNTGERHLDDGHLFAADLDLFGKNSLFERICAARTRPGETRLAEWLKSPAPREEILARQHAVADLAPRVELRERLAMLGGEIPGSVDTAGLVSWGQSPPVPVPIPWRASIRTLGAANLLAAVAMLTMGLPGVILGGVTLVISVIVILPLSQRIETILTPVESRVGDLNLLAHVLATLEQQAFHAPRLQELHARLMVAGMPPSRQIAELTALVEWLNARRNALFAPIAVLLLWRTQAALSIERWRRISGPAIADWLEAVASMEALSSLAGFAFEEPSHTFPEILDAAPTLEAEELGHPLLPRNRCICNDVAITPPLQLLMISGSNMSGKSTLLRSMGTNLVLALAGGTVRATRMRVTPLAIGATLRVQDSLAEGRSRFFAEITRVRAVLDLLQGPLPVLFLLDEVFHGTNSHDRVIGASAVIRTLLAGGAIGCVTTHDLSLTQTTETLGDTAKNVHFADHFADGQMCFDYTMRPGVVPKSNALALMRAVGLEV